MAEYDEILKGRGLRETISKNMPSGKFEAKSETFLPNGKLEHLVNVGSIKKVLVLSESEQDVDLATTIGKQAPKIFAICVLVLGVSSALRRAMILFLDNEFFDDNLPLPDPDDHNQQNNILETWESRLDDEEEPVWDGHTAPKFLETQWKFLAPSFDAEKNNHDFNPMSILPFLSRERMDDRGANGRIWKFEVHPRHIKGLQGEDKLGPLVAVKEIIPSDRKERQHITNSWISESIALKAMNKLENKHIVKFVTAFRRVRGNETDLYLMFEWADGGNLRELWSSEPCPERNTALLRAVVDQVIGLATALCAAHYPRSGLHWRHGDLKPENILWFRKGGPIGTLKIGDWGEAKGHNINTERRPWTSAGFATRRYEPPEVVVQAPQASLGQDTGRRRSRRYDIWPMGCITLEFLVWLIYGPAGLQAFNSSITGDIPQFYQIAPNRTAKIHDSVTEWMEDMAQDSICQVKETVLGDILEMVKKDLLVIGVDNPSRASSMSSSPTKSNSAGNTFSSAPAVEAIHERVAGLSLSSDPEDIPVISVTGPQPEDFTSEPTESKLDSNLEPKRGHGRARSDYFLWKMRSLVSQDHAPAYWSVDTAYRAVPEKFRKYLPAEITKDNTQIAKTQNVPKQGAVDINGSQYVAKSDNLAVAKPKQIDYGRAHIDRDWGFSFDNTFADTILSNPRKLLSMIRSDSPKEPRLCGQCKELRDSFWKPGFSITYSRQDLQAKALTDQCDLHNLLWQTCQQNRGAVVPSCYFQNIGSGLRLNGTGGPVLSVVKAPGMQLGLSQDVQISHAELPKAGSEEHLDILRHWVSNCDTMHKDSTCPPAQHIEPAPKFVRPTRLLDVGEPKDQIVTLVISKATDTDPWIALSHQWGPDKTRHFSTNSDNVDSHMIGLLYETLPATFKDAVTVTRALGLKYLWIDSLCIIQAGPREDFKTEAKSMEMVYSNAYCVIAASRASGHYSGFLQERKHRDSVTMTCGTDNNASYSICESIDKFKEHVLEGAMNKRGWVLQEHALARRTIFFTEHQTYWECGCGVRCETMTHLKNDLATLLGDPNFPDILSYMKLGERIIHFQNLYEQYSRLELSNAWDRPTAIDSLQQRLLRTMNVKGGFGVFDGGDDTPGLLRRSLLWHRDNSAATNLVRITELKSQIPTWSWMAHSGAIKYFEIKFDQFDWKDITSPWSPYSAGATSITAEAQILSLELGQDGEKEIIMDTASSSQQISHRSAPALNTDGSTSTLTPQSPAPSTDISMGVAGAFLAAPQTQGLMPTKLEPTMCIVLGNYRDNRSSAEQTHYFLVIAKSTAAENGKAIYERVGAGYAPGICIQAHKSEVILR